MTVNKSFESYKIKREIIRSGNEYIYYRRQRNEFGEFTGELEPKGTIKALYHERNQYVTKFMSDTTQYRQEKEPMLLCLYADTVLSSGRE